MEMMSHGKKVRIDWEKMRVGMSVFVPGLDPLNLKSQALAIGRKHHYTLVIHTRVEKSIVGVRIWRVL